MFHRVIKGFMAQGGDFSNADGSGGESIYGGTFADENFSRRHFGAGMLSMANRGPGTNGSQFFITFRSTPHLNDKHVVFGRLVQGEDVLRKIENVRTGPGDRPLVDVAIADCGEVAEDGSVGKASGVAPENEEEIDLGLDSDDDEDEDDPPSKAPSGGDPAAADAKDAADGAASSSSSRPNPYMAPPPQAPVMTAREKRLYDLRMKLNKGRKANRKAAAEEKRRITQGNDRPRKEQQHLERWREAEKRKKEMEESGVDSADCKYLKDTADAFAQAKKRRRKKEANKGSFGWNVFNSDARLRAFNKRLAHAPKGTLNGEEIRNETSLAWGGDRPPEHMVDHMVSELEETERRRKKFSRRRQHYAEADIDYINERNRVFNKKVKRSFDKYTVEIRQNLERGTAL